jgi:hypothetical protein
MSSMFQYARLNSDVDLDSDVHFPCNVSHGLLPTIHNDDLTLFWTRENPYNNLEPVVHKWGLHFEIN